MSLFFFGMKVSSQAKGQAEIDILQKRIAVRKEIKLRGIGEGLYRMPGVASEEEKGRVNSLRTRFSIYSPS